MSSRPFLLPLLSLITLAAFAMPVWAKGTVQLELVGDEQGSALLFQEWGQTLGQAGIRNVRIRNAQETDKLGIETRGTADSPVYVVTGKIVSRDEFVASPRRAIPTLRNRPPGPMAQGSGRTGAHGGRRGEGRLRAVGRSVSKVRIDLATSVGSTTQGMSRQRSSKKLPPAETAH